MTRNYVIFIDHFNNVVITQTGTPKKVRAHSSILPLFVRGRLVSMLTAMVDLDRSTHSAGYSAPLVSDGVSEFDHWFDAEVLEKAQKLCLRKPTRPAAAYLERGRVLAKPVDWDGFLEGEFLDHPDAYITGV